MLKLRRIDFNVPGGYSYVQAETGMKFDGNTQFKGQIQKILRHRTANGLPRATWAEVEFDLETHTCQRQPNSCYDTLNQEEKVIAAATPKPKRKCGSCGGRKKA